MRCECVAHVGSGLINYPEITQVDREPSEVQQGSRGARLVRRGENDQALGRNISGILSYLHIYGCFPRESRNAQQLPEIVQTVRYFF